MAETELDRTKRLALTIKETIETSSHEQREKLLNDLYQQWIVKPNQQNTMFDYLKLALNNFNLSTDNLQLGLFDRAEKVMKFRLTYLHMFLTQNDQIDDETKKQYEEKFTKLKKAVIDAGNAIGSSLYLMSSMTLEDIGHEKNIKMEMFRYSELDYDTMSACQSLILYLLEQLQRKEYRRYVVEDKGMCYQKIYNDKGHDTHAWKPAMNIKSFVIDMTRKDFNANMWKNLTASKENLKFVTQNLTDCLDPEFEDLAKDRHIFSFNNGVYITKIKYESEDDDDDRIWIDQWIPFEGQGAKKIGASVVSSKYFDLFFEDCSELEDWFDIIKTKCPYFISVMTYQQWPEEVQRWLCILMGRMLYNVGELDDWQVFIFLLGMAGSGKSTIIENIIKQFYEPADVGIVGNNIQKSFGLSALVGKKIVIGPEIKGNWGIDQAELQSMVSGESVSVNRKFKEAISEKFTSPLAIAGNVAPDFQDNAGSMSRRTIVFPFEYKVKKGDTKLGVKIQKEMAFIIQACNKGYLDAYHKYGTSGIWEVLPDLFKKTQESMTENTNALAHFLKTDLVVLGKDQYCREKIFVAAFNDHCKESHFSTSKWTSQFYSGPFADNGIKLTKNQRRRYPNKPGEKTFSGSFIFGVDIKEAESRDDDDDDDDNDTSAFD
jgi:hypothetical protein